MYQQINLQTCTYFIRKYNKNMRVLWALLKMFLSYNTVQGLDIIMYKPTCKSGSHVYIALKITIQRP